MQIRIRTVGGDLPGDVTSYLNDRLAAIERLLGQDTETTTCEVEMGRAVGHHKEGDVWRVELQIIRGGERHKVEAIESSINAATDAAKDEMLQKLRKSKGRHFVLARRAGAKMKEWLRFGA